MRNIADPDDQVLRKRNAGPEDDEGQEQLA